MNKTALTIAAVLTAFVLVVLGGVVYVSRVKAESPAPVAGLDPQTEQAILDREAAYQTMIQEANNRLAELQTQNQQLQAMIAQPAQPAQPEQITPEQAAQIAAQALGQTQVFSVETTMVSGQSVYAVTFSSGDIAYVSLSGEYLGVQPAPAPQTVVVQQPGRSGEREREHEGGDD